MGDPTLAVVRKDIHDALASIQEVRVSPVRNTSAMRSGDAWVTLQKLVPVTMSCRRLDATLTVTVFLSTDESAAERGVDRLAPELLRSLSAAGFNVQSASQVSIGGPGRQPMLAVEVTLVAAVSLGGE